MSHGDDVLFELAIQSVGSVTVQHYLAGRCLLAIEKLKAYEKYGLSGSTHYAVRFMGLSRKEAQTVRRVAARLEDLPRLRQAGMHGEVWWSQLREVVSVATPETDVLWFELCRNLSCQEVRQLVKLTPRGGIPGTVDSPPERRTSEYRTRFSPEAVTMIERGLRLLSKKEGKSLTFAEGVEKLFARFLGKKRYEPQSEKMREEAWKEDLAERLHQQPLVAKARQMAESLGMLDEKGNRIPEEPVDFENLGALEQSQGTGDHTCSGSCCHAAATPDGPPLRLVERSASEPTAPKAPHLKPVNPCCSGHEADHSSDCSGQDLFPILDSSSTRILSHLMAGLRFNPKARHPSKAQRAALLRRDRHCCRTPGCPNHIWLEIHHIKRFCEGGETLPDYLITLCTRCHKNVHEGKLFIYGTVSGGLLFTDAQGRDLARAYHLERAGWLDFVMGWHGAADNSHTARAMNEPILGPLRLLRAG